MTTLQPTPMERMRCMEVWGGNSRIDRGLTTPGLEIWMHSQPHEKAATGGDVYYLSSCASGRVTRLLLADVSGHGREVARLSTDLRDLMRRNVNLIDQSRFVSEMNRQFAKKAQRDKFATALVCTYFTPTRSLQFCNAGHPVPFLYRVEHDRWSLAPGLAHIERARGTADTPLGAYDGAKYSRFEVMLSPGDMVLCVSDAFTEALNADGNMLGANGLLDIIQTLDTSLLEEVVRQLQERLRWEHPDNLRHDDASVLMFRADGSSPSLTSDLFAPFRLLRGVRDSCDFEDRSVRDWSRMSQTACCLAK